MRASARRVEEHDVKRKTLDLVFSTGGVAFAGLLFLIGVVLSGAEPTGPVGEPSRPSLRRVEPR